MLLSPLKFVYRTNLVALQLVGIEFLPDFVANLMANLNDEFNWQI